MSRRVLFIAFPFPPSRGAGVYRTVAIANFLASAGWEVTVVTPEENYFLRYQGSEDRSLMDWPDSRIEVRRVPLTKRQDAAGDTRRTVWSSLFPSASERTRRRWRRYVSPLEGYDFWFRPALRASMRSIRSKKPDVILATGNPFNSFLVANLVKRRTGIPYVLDYRDAWTFDQFTGKLKPGATDVALALERRALLGSSAYVSVNQPIVDWLAEMHSLPDRVQRLVIENGYDLELMGEMTPTTPRLVSDQSPIILAHVGTLVPGKLDWPEVLREFEETAHMVDFDVELHIHGHLGFSDIQNEMMRDLFGGDATIRHMGPVGKKDVFRVYNEADALYLPMYESPYVTSGKVYEMMATGKPILAWGPDSSGAMEPLRGYPLLVRADRTRPETWRESLNRIADLCRTADPDLTESAKEYAKRYERTNLLRPLLGLLEGVIDGA